MSTRQNKKIRKGRNNAHNRERTVTTLTEAPNTPYLVPTPSEEPAGSQNHNSFKQGGGGKGHNIMGPQTYQQQGNFAFGYNAPFGHVQPMQHQHHRQHQQQPYYTQPLIHQANFQSQQMQSQSQALDFPKLQAPLPPGKNDLEILRNLKQTIKDNQHPMFRAIPTPEALARYYKADDAEKVREDRRRPEQKQSDNRDFGDGQGNVAQGSSGDNSKQPRLQGKVSVSGGSGNQQTNKPTQTSQGNRNDDTHDLDLSNLKISKATNNPDPSVKARFLKGDTVTMSGQSGYDNMMVEDASHVQSAMYGMDGLSRPGSWGYNEERALDSERSSSPRPPPSQMDQPASVIGGPELGKAQHTRRDDRNRDRHLRDQRENEVETSIVPPPVDSRAQPGGPVLPSPASDSIATASSTFLFPEPEEDIKPFIGSAAHTEEEPVSHVPSPIPTARALLGLVTPDGSSNAKPLKERIRGPGGERGSRKGKNHRDRGFGGQHPGMHGPSSRGFKPRSPSADNRQNPGMRALRDFRHEISRERGSSYRPDFHDPRDTGYDGRPPYRDFSPPPGGRVPPVGDLPARGDFYPPYPPSRRDYEDEEYYKARAWERHLPPADRDRYERDYPPRSAGWDREYPGRDPYPPGLPPDDRYPIGERGRPPPSAYPPYGRVRPRSPSPMRRGGLGPMDDSRPPIKRPREDFPPDFYGGPREGMRRPPTAGDYPLPTAPPRSGTSPPPLSGGSGGSGWPPPTSASSSGSMGGGGPPDRDYRVRDALDYGPPSGYDRPGSPGRQAGRMPYGGRGGYGRGADRSGYGMPPPPPPRT